MSSVAIIMTLCCISIDRYIAVTRPTRYRSIVTVKRACLALVVVWGQGLLYASLPLFGWSKYEYDQGTLHCSPKWTDDCSYYIYLAVVGFAIPAVLMGFTYIHIFFVIRKHSRKVSSVRRPRIDVKKKASTCKLVSVTQRQNTDPNLIVYSYPEHKERLSNSVEKINPFEEQTIISTNMELSSFDNCARQPAGELKAIFVKNGEKCVISTEIASENTCSDSSSIQRRCKCGTVGELFRRYFSRKNRRALTREYKVAKTGVILLVIFIVLWLSYVVVHICSARFKAPQIVFRFSMWLVFMNGVLNPIFYAFGNSSVKMRFEQMFSTIFVFCCKCRRKERECPNLRISETI